jgi:hypothetical protein
MRGLLLVVLATAAQPGLLNAVPTHATAAPTASGLRSVQSVNTEHKPGRPTPHLNARYGGPAPAPAPPVPSPSPPSEPDLGPPMLDQLWNILEPPEHNKLRTVTPDTPKPRLTADALESAALYEALDLHDDAQNFTVLDFGSTDGGLSLRTARKHPSCTVVAVALARSEEEHGSSRVNHTRRHLELASELGASNSLLCQPPVATTAPMLLWWLYRQPVLFDYVVISAQALQIMIEELLPHELEQLMGRAMQLAKVLIVQPPTDATSVRYLQHWEGKAKGLLRNAGTTHQPVGGGGGGGGGEGGGVRAVTVSDAKGGRGVLRAKASFTRVMCLPEARAIASQGLFVGEGVPRLTEDYQEQVEACLAAKRAGASGGTATLVYDDKLGGSVAMDDTSPGGSSGGDGGIDESDEDEGAECIDERCELHVSMHLVLQLGLGEGQRRALFAAGLRIDVAPQEVQALATSYGSSAAAVFVARGTAAFVQRWVEVTVQVPKGGGLDGDGAAEMGLKPPPCQLNEKQLASLDVHSATSNDAKFTVEVSLSCLRYRPLHRCCCQCRVRELPWYCSHASIHASSGVVLLQHPSHATVAARLQCPECKCKETQSDKDGSSIQCKHWSFSDTWELHILTVDASTTQLIVHRVDKDEGWGYGDIKVQYTICAAPVSHSRPAAAQHSGHRASTPAPAPAPATATKSTSKHAKHGEHTKSASPSPTPKPQSTSQLKADSKTGADDTETRRDKRLAAKARASREQEKQVTKAASSRSTEPKAHRSKRYETRRQMYDHYSYSGGHSGYGANSEYSSTDENTPKEKKKHKPEPEPEPARPTLSLFAMMCSCLFIPAIPTGLLCHADNDA